MVYSLVVVGDLQSWCGDYWGSVSWSVRMIERLWLLISSVVATLTLFARRCIFVMCANGRQSAFDSTSGCAASFTALSDMISM